MIGSDRARIVIVEDERIVACDLECRLKRMGYHVVAIVASAQAALETVRRETPAVVLMDILLEGSGDGIDCGRQIQDELRVPIIYVTAHADSQTFERAKHTAPCGYLVKPYDDGELHRAIELALHKHHRPGQRGFAKPMAAY